MGCKTVRDDHPLSRYQIPEASVIELTQDLTIRPRHTRVFIQDGEAWNYGQVDKHYPFCNFEVQERSVDKPQTIRADRFTVIRVVEGNTKVVSTQEIRFADTTMRNRFRDWVIWKDGAGINRFIHHWLHSERQPNVMRLTCYGGTNTIHEAQLPTLSDIKRQLGNIVLIKTDH